MLKWCIHDPTHVINFNGIEVGENVTFHEQPIKIFNYKIKKLKNKEILLIKVQWNKHNEINVSWELESEMREKFLELFDN